MCAPKRTSKQTNKQQTKQTNEKKMQRQIFLFYSKPNDVQPAHSEYCSNPLFSRWLFLSLLLAIPFGCIHTRKPRFHKKYQYFFPAILQQEMYLNQLVWIGMVFHLEITCVVVVVFSLVPQPFSTANDKKKTKNKTIGYFSAKCNFVCQD